MTNYSKNNYNVEAYCDYLKTEVSGHEIVTSSELGNYVAFCTINSNYHCNLKDIEIIILPKYTLTLKVVIIRESYYDNYGHNLAICREESKWVIYNDSEVSVCRESIIQNAYIFFFKVDKTNYIGV